MKRILLVTVAVWASGCGTVCNMTTGDLLPYGGVHQDLEWLNSSTPNAMNGGLAENHGCDLSGVSGHSPEELAAVLGLVVLSPFAPLLVPMTEIPLSTAADTVTLPVTFLLHPHYLRELREDSDF